ncbi:MAG: hypothetical protein AABZ74_06265, partial [Cyanobacteriota bacterium]
NIINNASRNKYLNIFEIPILADKKDKADRELNKYLADLINSIEEMSVLNVVAEFEKQIFQKLDESLLYTKKIIDKNYEKNKPFYKFRMGLIKTSDKEINKLSNIKNLLDGKIEKELFDKMSIIIEYRNFISHGKRFKTKGSNSCMYGIEEIVEILNEILLEINK